MNKHLERLTALALLLVCGAIVWSQLSAYSHAQSSSSGGTITVSGPNAACTTIRGGVTSVSGATAATTVDAGATGTVIWTAVKSMNRTFDIEVGGISSGTFRLGPLDSVTLSKSGASTPDFVTVGTTCSGCPSTATNVSIIACDDN